MQIFQKLIMSYQCYHACIIYFKKMVTYIFSWHYIDLKSQEHHIDLKYILK